MKAIMNGNQQALALDGALRRTARPRATLRAALAAFARALPRDREIDAAYCERALQKQREQTALWMQGTKSW